MILWQCKKFDELSVEELYKILQLRNEVFVVEQNCPYQDCDGKDALSYHFAVGEMEIYKLIPAFYRPVFLIQRQLQSEEWLLLLQHGGSKLENN